MMMLEYEGRVSFDNALVSIMGLTGGLYDQFEWKGESKSLNLTGLSKGVYFIKIETEDSFEVRKVVIQ